ncbi:uncharacterized protein [Montipora capricornis]|uniref:uncharacterized protein isoform X1 n=1 Tax=Montipora capricornis TaxID=246305 RepID=UPI0035F11C57
MKFRSGLVVSLTLCYLTRICLCGEGITQRVEKRFNIKGKEWVAAQKIINKLVDESIASRVKEAEHDVEHILESNIADHIKKTGKKLLQKIPPACLDKIEHCKSLYKSGVCKTSPTAMREHCAKTCNLCEARIVAKPQISINFNQGIKKLVKKYPAVLAPKAIAPPKPVIIKPSPQNPKVAQSSRKNGLLRYSEEVIPADTIKILHSIEPLLAQQTKGIMKFHQNDLTPENKKIRDAQKLLEYVKVLHPPKKIAFNADKLRKKSTTLKPKTHAKQVDKGKKVAKEGAKTKDKPKSKPSTKAVKSKVVKKAPKKKLKVKGTPLTSLSKTVTYKNHKYKITPVVDWERISKMLESLGYKAVHIVGVKDKKLHEDITEHLKNHGVDKVLKHDGKGKAAAETFVSAVHREKSWHNDEYFKANCHPMCLESCVSSCMPGCCREHDKVSVKTGLGKHCHPHCLVDCAPSCGSGCCSAEEERNRGHKFLHYQRMADYQKTKEKALAKQHDEPKLQHDYSKCHPQCKQTCIASCGPGCCTKEGERMRDEQQRKEKDERERERKEKEQTKAAAQAQREKDLKEIYKTQQRFCPAPCPKVCAPACADACCAFGRYAPASPGMPSQLHPGLMPNVPYPQSKNIPAQAFACKESCKFSCSYDCPRDCCQPEELAQQAAHEAAALAPPTEVGAPQSLYQDQAPESPTCPSPCPGGCYPSCTVACCTSALGLPIENDAMLTPETRSSTNRVLHVTHLVQPITGLNGCSPSCASHCSPACARSGCCDSAKKRK